MEVSQGVPGVILSGGECSRARIALETYPTSISFGPDPEISSTLSRMQMIEDATGRLETFALPVSVSQKLSDHIEEQTQNMSPQILCNMFMVPAPFVIGSYLFERARVKAQLQFAAQLRQMSLLSSKIAREQITLPNH